MFVKPFLEIFLFLCRKHDFPFRTGGDKIFIYFGIFHILTFANKQIFYKFL